MNTRRKLIRKRLVAIAGQRDRCWPLPRTVDDEGGVPFWWVWLEDSLRAAQLIGASIPRSLKRFVA